MRCLRRIASRMVSPCSINRRRESTIFSATPTLLHLEFNGQPSPADVQESPPKFILENANSSLLCEVRQNLPIGVHTPLVAVASKLSDDALEQLPTGGLKELLLRYEGEFTVRIEANGKLSVVRCPNVNSCETSTELPTGIVAGQSVPGLLKSSLVPAHIFAQLHETSVEDILEGTLHISPLCTVVGFAEVEFRPENGQYRFHVLRGKELSQEWSAASRGASTLRWELYTTMNPAYHQSLIDDPKMLKNAEALQIPMTYDAHRIARCLSVKPFTSLSSRLLEKTTALSSKPLMAILLAFPDKFEFDDPVHPERIRYNLPPSCIPAGLAEMSVETLLENLKVIRKQTNKLFWNRSMARTLRRNVSIKRVENTFSPFMDPDVIALQLFDCLNHTPVKMEDLPNLLPESVSEFAELSIRYLLRYPLLFLVSEATSSVSRCPMRQVPITPLEEYVMNEVCNIGLRLLNAHQNKSTPLCIEKVHQELPKKLKAVLPTVLRNRGLVTIFEARPDLFFCSKDSHSNTEIYSVL